MKIKKKLTNKEKDLEIKDLKLMANCLFTIILVIGVIFFFLSVLVYPHESELKINYEGLTGEEINHTKKIMSQVKEEYLYAQKRITFSNEPPCENCNGQNWARNIDILYVDNDGYLKRIICHELLHSIMYPDIRGEEIGPLHELVYDLAGQNVCFYKNKMELKLNRIKIK